MVAVLLFAGPVAAPSEPAPTWRVLNDDGWRVPDLENLKDPSLAYSTRTRLSGALEVIERGYWGSRKRVRFPNAGCDVLAPEDELRDRELVVAFVRGYFYENTVYAVRLTLRHPPDPDPLAPVPGCQSYSILLDTDGDGLFETLFPDVDPLSTPEVPDWLRLGR